MCLESLNILLLLVGEVECFHSRPRPCGRAGSYWLSRSLGWSIQRNDVLHVLLMHQRLKVRLTTLVGCQWSTRLLSLVSLLLPIVRIRKITSFLNVTDISPLRLRARSRNLVSCH
jgi:hypothetical protein